MRARYRASPCLVVALVAACASLAGCLDVLDGAVYRARTDAASIDVADAPVDRAIDTHGDRALDGGDATGPDVHDATQSEAMPPEDVADENTSVDAESEAGETDATEIDASVLDVMEIEASFTDGNAVEVVVPDVLPDIPCPVCGLGQTCCAGVCVSLSINEQNCGGCGIVCPAPGVCQSGSCGRCLLGLLCGGDQRCCVAGLLCGGILCP